MRKSSGGEVGHTQLKENMRGSRKKGSSCSEELSYFYSLFLSHSHARTHTHTKGEVEQKQAIDQRGGKS